MYIMHSAVSQIETLLLRNIIKGGPVSSSLLSYTAVGRYAHDQREMNHFFFYIYFVSPSSSSSSSLLCISPVVSIHVLCVERGLGRMK